jgi:hypothetical protein
VRARPRGSHGRPGDRGAVWTWTEVVAVTMGSEVAGDALPLVRRLGTLVLAHPGTWGRRTLGGGNAGHEAAAPTTLGPVAHRRQHLARRGATRQGRARWDFGHAHKEEKGDLASSRCSAWIRVAARRTLGWRRKPGAAGQMVGSMVGCNGHDTVTRWLGATGHALVCER